MKPEKKKKRLMTWDRLPTIEMTDVDQAIDWAARQGRGNTFLHWLEKVALAFEKPINKLVVSPKLNPLYHTGTIAFFLLVVVFGTGVYLLMFYQYGFEVSYESVANMEQFFISRAARAIHRYASGGLMIFVILHAYRMFFMGRFRGPRWLSWLAGMASMAVIWLAGITGYWLIWDQGAQLITQAFLNFLSPFPTLAEGFYQGFLAPSATDRSWLLMLSLMLAHLILSVLIGVLFWYHIKRLKRPKFFPDNHWMILMGALLVVTSLIFPAGLLPIADFSHVPDLTLVDIIYLFYLPAALSGSPSVLWIGVAVLVIVWGLVAALPWLLPPPKEMTPINIIDERCVACEKCVEDCPYGALTMVPRDDETPYQTLAQVDPHLCVSCGICIGSCDTMALTFGERPPELLWYDVLARLKLAHAKERPVKIIFTCERHAMYSGNPYIRTSPEEEFTLDKEDMSIEVVPVTCTAMLHPGLMTHTLEAGASEVQVVGCPVDDCTNREGNLWIEGRLTQKRAPKLKRSFTDAPIFTTWLSPNEFPEAVPLHAPQSEPESDQAEEEEADPIFANLKKRHFIILIILMALGLILQIMFTYVTYSPQPQDITPTIQNLSQ